MSTATRIEPDAAIWTVVAAAVAQELDRLTASREGGTYTPIHVGSLCAAECLLRDAIRKIDLDQPGHPKGTLRTIAELSPLLITTKVLSALERSHERTAREIATELEVHLTCLQATRTGDARDKLTPTTIESTKKFFLELQRQGNDARSLELTTAESPLLMYMRR